MTFLFLTLLGCPKEKAQKPVTGALEGPVATQDGPTVGGEVEGFASWMSANGRLAVIYRWANDTNGDGKLDWSFGQHGEAFGDQPEPFLYDLVEGTETLVDDVLTADLQGRRVVVRSEDQLWLVDSKDGSREVLDGALLKGDYNYCLPPRQASLDDTTLWYFTDGGLQARDLESGDERTIEREGLIWRVEPAGHGWGRILEVQADTDGDGKLGFPLQHTSCVCRWCTRFAASFGMYGWGGDEWVTSLAGPAGQLIPGAETIIPLDPATLVDLEASERVALDGARSATECPVNGAQEDVVYLDCEGGTKVMTAAQTWSLPTEDLALVEGARPAESWLPMVLDNELGRLNLATGAWEPAMEADSAMMDPYADWVWAFKDPEMMGLHVPTGQYWSANVSGVAEPFSTPRGWYEPGGATAADGRGCVLIAAQPGVLQKGPWTLRCPL